jgi:transmembrane sensor
VSDIGTKFEINRSSDILTIAVAEGQITVANPDGTPARLSSGQQLVATPASPMVISSVSAHNVGTWRQGRLIYSNVPLAIVAADITRNSGEKIAVDPALEQRTFSGVLVVEKGPQMLANLADLMAISSTRDGNQYLLRAAGQR